MNSLAVLLQSMGDSTPTQQQIQQIMLIAIPIILVVTIVAVAIIVVPFWFICKKAGMSPWLTLLNIVPLGNLVLIYVLAFGEWKVVPAGQILPYPPPYQPPYPPVPPVA